MAASAPPAGIDDATKQAWVERCATDPAFRDALIVETYIQVQQMLQIAAQVAAQLGPATGLLSKMGFGGKAEG